MPTKDRVEYWQRVGECLHEWSGYEDSGSCANAGCGWTERRCKKCYVYEVTCPCGFEDGTSGWPYKRWSRVERRKEQQRLSLNRV